MVSYLAQHEQEQSGQYENECGPLTPSWLGTIWPSMSVSCLAQYECERVPLTPTYPGMSVNYLAHHESELGQ